MAFPMTDEANNISKKLKRKVSGVVVKALTQPKKTLVNVSYCLVKLEPRDYKKPDPYTPAAGLMNKICTQLMGYTVI